MRVGEGGFGIDMPHILYVGKVSATTVSFGWEQRKGVIERGREGGQMEACAWGCVCSVCAWP